MPHTVRPGKRPLELGRCLLRHAGGSAEEKEAVPFQSRHLRAAEHEVGAGDALGQGRADQPGGPQQGHAVRDAEIGRVDEPTVGRIRLGQLDEIDVDGHDLAGTS